MGRSDILVIGISELGGAIFKLIKAKNFSEMIIDMNCQIKRIFSQAIQVNLNVYLDTACSETIETV